MKHFLLPFLFLSFWNNVFAVQDSVVIPISRQRFHDRIDSEQVANDKADGKRDDQVRVSTNEDINLQVTDVLTRRIDELQELVETDNHILSNNEKVRQLNFIEALLKNFRTAWKQRKLNPALAPTLVEDFYKAWRANMNGASILPIIRETPYEAGLILTDLFPGNIGYKDSRKFMFLQYCKQHPDKILSSIRPYVNEAFADSMVVVACKNDPEQLYDYAYSTKSPEGKLIQRNEDPLVKAIVQLSRMENALLYYPFLDNILKNKISLDSIKKFVGDGDRRMDSVGYFKLLVKTEREYSYRLGVLKDTPIAMFGVNGLRKMLQRKAIKHFITPINNLHEQSNLNIRMRALDPLTAEELYYVMVMGENDIYTSSYKHSFERLLQRMGPKPSGDSLLLNVNMDYFKKFIKMAANFNQLDVFLKTMPSDNATTLMKAFVANLDEANNLEDAVDVADSYSSIKDSTLRRNILKNVSYNEQKSVNQGNNKGKIIYSLLKTIFLSEDDNSIDLTSQIGIPSIYSIDYDYMADDSGRVVQQVFFYGDEDGKTHFPQFVSSFSNKEWKITYKKEWVEIKSLMGKKVWIYANLPLNNDKNLDDTAQIHLSNYLAKNDLRPAVVVHRGHSYWLPRTIDRMAGDAKIIVLGSCGGYQNLSQIIDNCPDAHIISTKEIGKGDINRPILNYLNQAIASGKTLVWKDMWASLTKLFYSDPNKSMRESWDDYVPPYKNLGAIFIKAYNKKMEGQLLGL
ncbi:MAG: hypothetical protein JWP81_3110 [Ferruginibacter sp.]|nr:hypothetical protein [Ferruginibacter sp.]